MKTKEFIEKVELLDLRVEKINDTILVGDTNRYYCCLSRVERYELEIFHRHFEKLEEDVRHKLLYTVVEYIKTPIEEREEDKKYYLYNPIKKDYFNYFVEDETYFWAGLNRTYNIQTQFTEEEIKEHKFKDIMELLVKEEVKCQI